MALASPLGSRHLWARIGFFSVCIAASPRGALSLASLARRAIQIRESETYLPTSAIVTYLPVTPPTQISRNSWCDI